MVNKVVLVRHGIAEMTSAIGTDNARCLTGRGKATLLGSYPEFFPLLVAGADDPVITVMSSSAVRTMQTAEIICGMLGLPYGEIRTSHALTVQDDATIEDEIRQVQGVVIAVGHSPSIDEVASRMSGRIRMMLRGEALCLDMGDGSSSTGVVLWDCRPR